MCPSDLAAFLKQASLFLPAYFSLPFYRFFVTIPTPCPPVSGSPELLAPLELVPQHPPSPAAPLPRLLLAVRSPPGAKHTNLTLLITRRSATHISRWHVLLVGSQGQRGLWPQVS